MPIFYKGAGPGTYWDLNNAQIKGLVAHSPAILASPHRLVQHIARGTTGPYISLTRSYEVAWDYAVYCGRSRPVATPASPGFVYEVELDDPLPTGLVLLDPVSYQHDGSPQFLLGVLQPALMRKYLRLNYRQPPPATGTPRTPNLTPELETFVRALRDAEIVAIGAIPAACVRNRFPVHA